jgi:hypothetical protein
MTSEESGAPEADRNIREAIQGPRDPELGSLCAGINRHDAENARVSQERSSEPS